MVKIKQKLLSTAMHAYYKMSKNSSTLQQEKIINQLEKYKKKDFSFKNGKILGSMCTQPHPFAIKAYMKFLETNLGDPKLFPGSKEIEEKYIYFLKKLYHAPKNSAGIIGSGGTECNLNAIWLAKEINGKKEVIIPESAHFSFEKIASIMDIKLIPIKLDKNYVIDISEVKKKINKNTCAVVGIAGTTELGMIDPIGELADICIDEDLFLHVDAAFGGYIIPFLKKQGYNLVDFDFKVKGVDSISVDSHKMGCAAIPLGTLIIRDKNWIEKISVNTPYISCEKQAGILATRSGGPVAAAYALSEYLGIKGYIKIAETCMKNTDYLAKRIEELGLNLVTKPKINVLGVKLNKPEKITNELTKKGFKVNNMRRFSAIRFVLMPHVTKKTIDDFIPVFEKVCKKYGEI